MVTDRGDAVLAAQWLEHCDVSGVDQLRRLHVQGTTTTTFALVIDGRPAVLKMFDLAPFTAAFPDIALREAQAMRTARRELGAVVPDVIAAGDDPIPAVLMEHREGSPSPIGCDHRQVIDILVRLHDLAQMDDLPSLYGPWADLENLEAPTWSDRPATWQRLIERIAARPIPGPDVFLHRDVQPANLLWTGIDLVGVIDWTFACRGPRSVDVAHYCMNVALCEGAETAARVEATYWEQVGQAPDQFWDAVELLAVAQQPAAVASGLASSGLHLGVDDVMERCEQHATRIALGHLD